MRDDADSSARCVRPLEVTLSVVKVGRTGVDIYHLRVNR
ncbi:hypothetical protein MPS_5580 [Mycobacterium pseudoshottsii JCM 15466]|nr:hypothetical protein MPS_5580 [Mycobacterium pseudoshottsii JCM 15466]